MPCRSARALAAVALLLRAPPPAPPQDPQTPAFPTKVEVVTVDAVVVDGKGRAVPGLERSDFTLLEDGVPQAITSFEAVELPAGPPPAAPGSAGPPRPVLQVRRRLSPGSVLDVQNSVLGAARDEESRLARVSAGYEVRRADGAVFKSAAPTRIAATSLGSLLRLNGISLAGAEPGQYELVLRVRDELGGRDPERREPFEIAPADPPRGRG